MKSLLNIKSLSYRTDTDEIMIQFFEGHKDKLDKILLIKTFVGKLLAFANEMTETHICTGS